MNTGLFDYFAPAVDAPPLRCSAKKLAAAAVTVLAALIILEARGLPEPSPLERLERQAAVTMEQASAVVRAAREASGYPIHDVLDPNRTGLIGLEYSDITTTEGSLIAKRTSTNPAFAAVVARMLSDGGVKRGDRVAVNMSGSFPALNIAVLSACKALELEPRIISSVGASNYGANVPGLTWLDMERLLNDAGLFPYRAVAVSLGGVVETGGGIDGTGIELGLEAVRRHGAPLLEEGDYRTVVAAMDNRQRIFDAAGPVAAFISVGGSLTSLGWVPEAARLEAGLLRRVPASADPARGLIFRYVERGIPAVHLLNVARLAERNALPVDPIPLPRAEDVNPDRFRQRFRLTAMVAAAWCAAGLVLMVCETRRRKREIEEIEGV
ncbi:MAG: poly-gamma-glutamate system protein [Methylobacteriaceae bacterium]|jgi:poly-gamma-glutamate system protein|nr:poly-gamma-glutamate system protein [Methylobacteriaceae bacterium]